MLDLVEDGAEREGVVVVVEVRDGDDVADRALLDEQRGRSPGRRPAAVLVDRDARPQAFALLDELASRLQIVRERLLGEHVLAGRERLPDERRAHVGVRRDVDDLDLRVAQELVEISEDPSRRRTPRTRPRRLRPQVVHADHTLSVAPVARKVRRPDDAAAPDDADARAIVHRERRAGKGCP